MALPDDVVDALTKRYGDAIAMLARAKFDEAMAAIAGGAAPRDAIALAQAGFTGEYSSMLAKAFSELLGRAIGTADVREMPVGAIKLSQRLHLNDRETTAHALAVIREHAQGVHQARELALQLYDGYRPGDPVARPLEGRARAELPAALRALSIDAADRASLQRVIDAGVAQAKRLKSSALRAGYIEAFDAWKKGAGADALRRKLDIAVREKNRYTANRIAQTELARAHQAQVARDLMADQATEVAQVMINPRHPKTDICDLHARADLYGLGPGCYPKAKAPVPPYHPFCFCRLRGRPSLSAAGIRKRRGAEAAYLRSMPLEQAGQVMGSVQRAQAALAGASVDDVVNAGVDPLYRLRRAGDLLRLAELTIANPTPHPSALERAAEASIPDTKLLGYVLNLDHPRGGHKARLFSSILGFSKENAQSLRDAILEALPFAPAMPRLVDQYGARFQVDVTVVGPKGGGTVRTAWIIREAGAAPGFISAVVLKEKTK